MYKRYSKFLDKHRKGTPIEYYHNKNEVDQSRDAIKYTKSERELNALITKYINGKHPEINFTKFINMLKTAIKHLTIRVNNASDNDKETIWMRKRGFYKHILRLVENNHERGDDCKTNIIDLEDTKSRNDSLSPDDLKELLSFLETLKSGCTRSLGVFRTRRRRYSAEDKDEV